MPSLSDILDTVRGSSSSVSNITTGTIGGRIGTIAGGLIKTDVVRGINKIQQSLFGDSMVGALIGQFFGDLLTRSANELQDMQARGDPALNFQWVVTMPNDFFPLDINPFVEEIEWTMPGIATNTVTRPERDVTYAQRFTAPTLSVTLYEDAQNRFGTQYFEEWAKKTMDFSGLCKYPLGESGYKKRLVAAVVTPDNQVSGFYIFFGVWPTGQAQYNMGSGNSQRIQVRQTLSCDSIQFYSANSPQANISVGTIQGI